MSKSIVVGTDGSPSADRAVEWAAADAVRRGYPLRIVHAVRPWNTDLRFGPAADTSASLATAGERVLAQAVALAAKVGPELTITPELIFDAPAVALRACAGQSDEIVIGHRGLGGFADVLLGSTGRRVAGHTSCPVVVVRGETDESRREVLAGVDPSDAAAPAVLEYAFKAAALRGSWVRAVHVWQVPADSTGGDIRLAVGVAEERLARIVAPARSAFPSVRAIEEVASGRPGDELIDRSRRSDLLVIGPHRHRTSRHCGQIGHNVIRHADCPVAVIGEPPA